jgi:hypothetical protein
MALVGKETANNKAKFVQARQPDTPRQLYHYTKLKNVFNMLDVGSKSVCFWLKNNKNKNDAKELKYGRELMEKVRDYYRSEGQPSLLDLKRKYPMSNIRQIARLMHKTADEVKEDIFGLHFSKDNHRCFDKLKRDMS